MRDRPDARAEHLRRPVGRRAFLQGTIPPRYCFGLSEPTVPPKFVTRCRTRPWHGRECFAEARNGLPACTASVSLRHFPRNSERPSPSWPDHSPLQGKWASRRRCRPSLCRRSITPWSGIKPSILGTVFECRCGPDFRGLQSIRTVRPCRRDSPPTPASGSAVD